MAFPIVPILLALPQILPVVVNIVQLVEQLVGNGNGEKKKTLAQKLVLNTIRGIEGFKGEVADEEALAEAAGQIIDGVVGVLNAFGALNGRTLDLD